MIELPGWLDWLGAVVGMQWPDGDEDRMREMAAVWHSAAAALRQIESQMDAAESATRTAYSSGEGAAAMLDDFASMRTGPNSVPALAGNFDDVGDSVEGGATQIEYTKLMFYSTLAITAADIAAVWVFPPTAPAEEAGIIIGARVAVRELFARALEAMGEWAVKLGENALIKFLFRHVALNALLGVVQDAAIQEWQVLARPSAAASSRRSGRIWAPSAPGPSMSRWARRRVRSTRLRHSVPVSQPNSSTSGLPRGGIRRSAIWRRPRSIGGCSPGPPQWAHCRGSITALPRVISRTPILEGHRSPGRHGQHRVAYGPDRHRRRQRSARSDNRWRRRRPTGERECSYVRSRRRIEQRAPGWCRTGAGRHAGACRH
jgi:hypothetical protein